MDITIGEAILIGLVGLPALWANGVLLRALWRRWRNREVFRPFRRIRESMSFDGRR